MKLTRLKEIGGIFFLILIIIFKCIQNIACLKILVNMHILITDIYVDRMNEMLSVIILCCSMNRKYMENLQSFSNANPPLKKWSVTNVAHSKQKDNLIIIS